MSQHLKKILWLAGEYADHDDPQLDIDLEDLDRIATYSEILDATRRMDLPVFISIDASLKDGWAVSSINIIIPDIRPNDTESEWHQRPAKPILTRSWRLPNQWGTGQTCINMAEALGFIIGEYTIPENTPILYITGSNNA